MTVKIDAYELLTEDELESVTNILLEALAREKCIIPEVFEIETNILVEEVEDISNNSYSQIPTRY